MANPRRARPVHKRLGAAARTARSGAVWIGDAIDFWRVGDFEPDERLLLHAEMKVPGDAWLEFRAKALDADHSELIQTAFFRPSPYWGRIYWYVLYPIHWFIFRGMAKRIVWAAEALARVALGQTVGGGIVDLSEAGETEATIPRTSVREPPGKE